MPRKPDTKRRSELAMRAFEVIQTRGVHKITMSDLAAGLGMKRPTLYWYFPDLKAVFEEVVSHTYAELELFMLSRLQKAEHPLDFLMELIEGFLAFFTPRRDMIVAMFQLWAVAESDEPERALSRGREFIGPLRLALIERIAQGIRDGLVAPCDPASVVDLAICISDGAQVEIIAGTIDVERVLENLRRLVIEPLRLPAAQSRAQ